MTETDRELGLQDEDRLPWLEAVENDEEEEGLSGNKLMGFLLTGLLALGLIIGGIWWLRNQSKPDGDGTLIAAQEGDYKVKPDDPGGMKVEGQGDSAFAASEGAVANGKIDAGAKTETPVAGQKIAAAQPKTVTPTTAKPVVTTVVPPSGGKLAPAAPTMQPGTPSGAPAGGGGTLVQFGAYGSQAGADAAWSRLVSANPQLAKLTKIVVPAAVGGNTLYRLRANAGSPANAAAVCKAAGNCIIVR
jgi:hypothetical protein